MQFSSVQVSSVPSASAADTSASCRFPRTYWLSACCVSSHAHSADSQSVHILSPLGTCTNHARFKFRTPTLTPCRLGYKHRLFEASPPTSSRQSENSDDYPKNVGTDIIRNVSSRISVPTASYSERLASSNICFEDERRFFGKQPNKSLRNLVCFSDCRMQDKTTAVPLVQQTRQLAIQHPAQLSLFAVGDTPNAACLFFYLTTYCADVALRTVLCHTRHQFCPHNRGVCLT